MPGPFGAVRGGASWGLFAVAAALAHLQPAAPLVPLGPAFLAPTPPLCAWLGLAAGSTSSAARSAYSPLAMTGSAGDYELEFGKNKGKKIRDIQRSYLEWMTAEVKTQPEAVAAAQEWMEAVRDGRTQTSSWAPTRGDSSPKGGGWPPRVFNLGLAGSGQLAVSWPSGALEDGMKAALARIKGARFDGANDMFHFDIKAYDAVVKVLRGFRPQMGKGLDVVPASIVKGLATCTEEDEASVQRGLARLSPKIREKLMPFQLEGVRFALKHAGRAMIADEMGLGKTVQSLAIASMFRDEWPLLVLCPASLRLHWASEITKWLPDHVNESDVQVVSSGKDPVDGLVVVCSYSLLPTVVGYFKKRPRVILADESHYMKSSDAKRTKVCIPLIRDAHRAILLSGTPALARPSELFSQLHALRPKLFASAVEYEERYCNPRQMPWGRDISGEANLQELSVLLEHVMIRRAKSDVLNQLPPKTYQTIYLPISEAKMSELKKLEKEEAELGRSNDDSEDMEDLVLSVENKRKGLTAKMRQKTGLAKLPAACEYIADLIDGGTKVLIFAHHVKVMDGLEKAVKKTQAGYIRIDGSVPQDTRQEMVEVFKKDLSVRAALLSLTAASQGLDFTSASTVVFVELDWTPGRLNQAEDRAHRIGQVNSVNIQYLIAKGTIDERIWQSITRKERVTSSFLDGHS